MWAGRKGGRGRTRDAAARAAHALAIGVVLAALSPWSTVPAAAQDYVPSGTPLTGGDDVGSAVGLPPGQYVDGLARGNSTAGQDGSARYYAITVRAGETPYLSATVAPRGAVDTSERLAVSIELTAAGGTSTCESDTESDDGSDDRLEAVTAVVSPGPAGSTDGCPPGKIVVRVARGGDFATDDPLDVELAYRLEPAADTAGLPGTSAELDTIAPQLTGPPAALRSGDSFATAPVLGDGIYRDTLTADDTRIVRVHLDWGQRLAYSVTTAGQPGLDSSDALDVVATIRSPVRAPVVAASGGSDRASVGADDARLDGSTPAPIRYANRDSDDSDVAACSVAGDWFLVLETDHPSTGTGTDTRVPYTLQVQVFGTASGAPDYRIAPGTTASATTPTSSDGRSRVVAITAGAVAVVAGSVLFVLVLLLRRRRTRQAPTHTHTPSR